VQQTRSWILKGPCRKDTPAIHESGMQVARWPERRSSLQDCDRVQTAHDLWSARHHWDQGPFQTLHLCVSRQRCIERRGQGRVIFGSASEMDR